MCPCGTLARPADWCRRPAEHARALRALSCGGWADSSPLERFDSKHYLAAGIAAADTLNTALTFDLTCAAEGLAILDLAKRRRL